MHSIDEIVNKLVNGARQGLLGSIGGRFLGVIGSVAAARLLGPETFGLYAVGWTLLRFLSLIFPMGMDRALFRFAPIYWKRDAEGFKGLLLQTNAISLITGLFFGIILFILAPWLAFSVYQRSQLLVVFRLFSFVFPMLSLLIVSSAATRVTQHVIVSVIVQDLTQPLLGLILMLSFYFLGLQLNGVILSDIVSISLATIVILIAIRYIFPEIIHIGFKLRTSVRELLKYSVPAAFGGAFSVYVFWIDRILVGYYMSSVDNGIYLAVSQISTIFLVISAGINTIVVPLFSDLFHKKDMNSLEEIYRISTKWGIYISISILAVLILSPGESLSVVYGDTYKSGASVLLILLVGQIVNLITGSVNPLLIMTGNQKILFRLSGIALGLDIILNVLLIPKFGLIGAATSTSVSLSILYISAVLWVKHNLRLWPYDARYIKGVVATIVTILTVIVVKTVFSDLGLMTVVLQGIASLFIFVFALIIQKPDSEDLKFLKLFSPIK
jgi:O-antigen/teichoic acid export membrane protein